MEPRAVLACRPPRRVLIVNDIKEITDLLAHFFTARGFAVNKAYDGETALALARVVVPDILILNQIMPGHCGLEVLAALQEDTRTRKIKTIMHSALPMEKQARLAGACGFFAVPFRVADVMAAVDAALQGR